MASKAWALTGNKSTNPATNALGTTDNEPLVIETVGTERIRVDTSGNVGIGTKAPQKPLDVASSGGIRISQTAQASDTNEVYFADNGQIRSLDDNHRIIFNRAGNELEFREYGMITFSAGATVGQRTATAYLDSNGFHLSPSGVGGYSTIDSSYDPAVGSTLIFRTSIPRGPFFEFREVMRIDSSGNVGIGTPSPSQLLSLSGAESTGNGFGAAIGLSNSAPGGRNWYLRAGATGTATPAGGFSIADDADYRVTIDSSGNVGIGTTTPATKLHVAGDLTVTGDVLLTNADCAEQFDASGSEPPEPGTVVVIDEDGALRESRIAYDKKVAGVVSGAGEYRHAVVLDRRPSEKRRIPVALVGKVCCKVDAQYSPIEVGDLLTTSPTPGHAMKVTDPLRAVGSVIGKALKPLQGGQGLIPILVALQ